MIPNLIHDIQSDRLGCSCNDDIKVANKYLASRRAIHALNIKSCNGCVSNSRIFEKIYEWIERHPEAFIAIKPRIGYLFRSNPFTNAIQLAKTINQTKTTKIKNAILDLDFLRRKYIQNPTQTNYLEMSYVTFHIRMLEIECMHLKILTNRIRRLCGPVNRLP